MNTSLSFGRLFLASIKQVCILSISQNPSRRANRSFFSTFLDYARLSLVHHHLRSSPMPLQRGAFFAPEKSDQWSTLRSISVPGHWIYHGVRFPLPFHVEERLMVITPSMTLDNATDVLSGGTLTFNNRTVIIPRNLLVNLPALTAVSWPEMFNADGTPNLPLWPKVNWEAAVSIYTSTYHLHSLLFFIVDLCEFHRRSIHSRNRLHIPGIVFNKSRIHLQYRLYHRRNEDWRDVWGPNIGHSVGY
jgi:hypothetical protein